MRRVTLIGKNRETRGLGVLSKTGRKVDELNRTPRSGTTVVQKHLHTPAVGSVQTHGSAGHSGTIGYSYHQYVFHPDNYDAPETGDGQGPLHLSGPYDETVAKISLMAKTAPDGNLTVQVEYADTGDLDTAASWTEIEAVTNASAKQTDVTSGFTTGTIPAGRLIRCNWDAINGAADAYVILGVWRPVRAGTS